MQKINDNILCWCSNPPEGAIAQAVNLSKHPFLVGNVCLMPDTHEGYGMPIGGVVALDNALSPNMVGVDIGCGMLAVKTSYKNISKEKLQNIINIIRQTVPVGFNHHEAEQYHPIFDSNLLWADTFICKQEFTSAKKQIGTLGGGNHFIEIQQGNDGHVWFMIHSGSRNLGKKVAEFYNKRAENLCKMWKYNELVNNMLCVLPKGTEDFELYKKEMETCLHFSNANRELMAEFIKQAFLKVCPDINFENTVNIQHNYAALENHFRKDVWVHRKGATLATADTIGIIPGSQGTSSYIVKGKGNKASLCSCSHGAGRKMSRTKAREKLNLEAEQKILNDKGILHNITRIEDLDEAASAYKDIDEVMKQQADLVDILVKLEPLAVIKG